MIPLPTAVAAIRKHEPTKDVVPKWLSHRPRCGIDTEPWIDTRTGQSMRDDAARLIVEACMWRYYIPCKPTQSTCGMVLIGLDRKIWATKPHSCECKECGDDFIAALVFACDVQVPDKETP